MGFNLEQCRFGSEVPFGNLCATPCGGGAAFVGKGFEVCLDLPQGIDQVPLNYIDVAAARSAIPISFRHVSHADAGSPSASGKAADCEADGGRATNK